MQVRQAKLISINYDTENCRVPSLAFWRSRTHLWELDEKGGSVPVLSRRESTQDGRERSKHPGSRPRINSALSAKAQNADWQSASELPGK